MTTATDFHYHPLIKPYATAYSQVIAGILGWRFISTDELEQLVIRGGGSDRVALATEALKKVHNNITFSFRKSVLPLVAGSVDHHQLLSLVAQQFIGHCWEILKYNNFIPVPEKAGPVLEFCRHVRNGSYHGNHFFFETGKPPFEAKWHDLDITANLQGKRVFRDSLKEKEYFLNYGDALYLLLDISKLLN